MGWIRVEGGALIIDVRGARGRGQLISPHGILETPAGWSVNELWHLRPQKSFPCFHVDTVNMSTVGRGQGCMGAHRQAWHTHVVSMSLNGDVNYSPLCSDANPDQWKCVSMRQWPCGYTWCTLVHQTHATCMVRGRPKPWHPCLVYSQSLILLAFTTATWMFEKG